LNTMQGGGRQPKVSIPVITPDRINKRQNGRRFKDNNEPMFTLTAQDRHGIAIKEATKKKGMQRQMLAIALTTLIPQARQGEGE
ncbi:hypothetical protein NQ048_11120, partial [Corynebacterium sp. 209RC1]